MVLLRAVATAAWALIVVSAHAQSVFPLKLADAKSRLLTENLAILASKYDIANAEAEAVQARVWNNPNFVWNSDMYNVEKNQY
jgi:hypothetical protein